MTGFDPRWLTSPVDRRAVRAFADGLRRSGFSSSSTTGTVIATVLVCIVAAAVLTPLLVSVLDAEGSGAFAATVALVAVIAVSGTLIARASIRRETTAHYRLHGFAEANAMDYVPEIVDPALPGLIFNQGRSRRAVRRVRGAQPRFVEFANYRYTTGSGKNSTTHTWGYVAIHLDTPLPHIVLDAKGNNALFGSNLPASFDKDQRLGLEGNFDEFFTLYCPQGYEPDALYLFTPDIMARLMDRAAELDVEIVDDWLFLYARRDFVTLDPQTWGWLFSVVSALMDKLQRWERWRDERLAAPTERRRALPSAEQPLPFRHDRQVPPPRLPKGVAQQGRRLSRRISWVAWVVAILLLSLMGFVLWNAISAVG